MIQVARVTSPDEVMLNDVNALLSELRSESGEPMGTQAELDVVVSETYRGQGLGQKAMEVLMEEARKNGATQLYLTSRPHRVPTHKLYEKLGFQKKETQVFKLAL